MCDIALMNNKTPCKILSYPSTGKSPAHNVCPQCCIVGEIRSPTTRTRASKTVTWEHGTKEYDGSARLNAQLNTIQPLTRSDPSRPSLNDEGSIRSLTEATFVMVEHEDSDEQFDEVGAPPPSAGSDEDIDRVIGSNVSPLKDFGTTIGRFFACK